LRSLSLVRYLTFSIHHLRPPSTVISLRTSAFLRSITTGERAVGRRERDRQTERPRDGEDGVTDKKTE
jgi:hypothetical protein